MSTSTSDTVSPEGCKHVIEAPYPKMRLKAKGNKEQAREIRGS
jgi:hypothetical protein